MLERTDLEFVRNSLAAIGAGANKYDRGRLFMVCGSFGMAGACIMAASAALRSGAGYIDIAVPEEIYSVVAAGVPEAVFTIYSRDCYGRDCAGLQKIFAERLKKADACLLGCGLGELREAVCPTVLELCEKPILIDADGINYMAEHPRARIASKDIVLTPHAGELSRLIKRSVPEIERGREAAAREAAECFGAAVLLKGAGTAVIKGESGYVNPTGNAGLARAGSGDVLSGIISSLMAQGTGGLQAAVAGAYIHGLAGDICAEKLSKRAMLPRDIIERLPDVFLKLEAAERRR